MDKVFERIGLYDLIGVMVPGGIITMVLMLYLNKTNEHDIVILIDKYYVLILLSYLFGTIFQEIGHWLFLRLPLLKKALEKRSKYNQRALSQSEYDEIIKHIKKNNINNNEMAIYNWCKYYLQKNNIETYTREQALGALSRSLSLFFGLMPILVLFKHNNIGINDMLCYISIFITLAVLLFIRATRFIIDRYVLILKNYYYLISQISGSIDK